MTKALLFLLLTTTLQLAVAQKTPKKEFITTHNRATINTDVSKGMKSFPAWGVFPSQKAEIRRIVMHLTLAHPDTMPIAHWDYLDFIYIRRVGGRLADSLNMEIARMLTPYGSSFKNNWSFTWDVDVTDFAMILRDSVEIEYMHSGWEPETLGWALTLQFEVVYGKPVATPLMISEIYNGKFPYGNPANPIENHLIPHEFEFLSNAHFGRIRVQHTGHGADRPDYCSEFCSRWREVHINNTIVDRRDLWKDCGSNPLYPQGGTWLYDRAYWCPGDLQQPDLIDFQARKGSQTIKFVMKPYASEPGSDLGAYESVAAYLIQYGKPLQMNDVAIEKIRVPTNNPQFSRQNPACFQPTIEFRNLGGENLKKLTITYGTKGFKPRKFLWEGNLAHNQSQIVVLPGEIDFLPGLNAFEVVLENPNGKKDGWPQDNFLASEFQSPVQLPLQCIIKYKANNRPQENSLFIVGSQGDTVYNRRPSQCKANETYTDTVSLSSGKYEFHLTDSAGNGLEYWAEPENGYGYVRFLDFQNNILHNFISDCGNGQFLAFHALQAPKNDFSHAQRAFFIYPRRAKQKIELDVHLPDTSRLEVRFLKNNEIQSSHLYKSFRVGTILFDISNLAPSRYIVEVFVNDKLEHRDRINKLE
jgi:hypothetical protein